MRDLAGERGHDAPPSANSRGSISSASSFSIAPSISSNGSCPMVPRIWRASSQASFRASRADVDGEGLPLAVADAKRPEFTHDGLLEWWGMRTEGAGAAGLL